MNCPDCRASFVEACIGAPLPVDATMEPHVPPPPLGKGCGTGRRTSGSVIGISDRQTGVIGILVETFAGR